jgi:hypothetical protein
MDAKKQTVVRAAGQYTGSAGQAERRARHRGPLNSGPACSTCREETVRSGADAGGESRTL